MKNRGFTLFEMMVSLVLFALVVTGALGLFIHQSRVATESRIRKIVSESVHSALRIIANDLRQSGSGIADPLSPGDGAYPELSLHVDVSDGRPQLYINWNGFLDFDARPGLGLPLNSVFRSSGYVNVSDSAAFFEIKHVPDSVQVTKDIGGLILRTQDSVSAENCRIQAWEKSGGTQTLKFTLLDKKTGETKKATGQASPAIVYKWVKNNNDPKDDGGQLFRNSIAILGNAPADAGHVGGNQLKVTGFHVQCKFYNPEKQLMEWSPKDGSMSGHDIRNLRLVRVEVDYTWRAPHRGLSRSTSTIDVAPRALVRVGVENAK